MFLFWWIYIAHCTLSLKQSARESVCVCVCVCVYNLEPYCTHFAKWIICILISFLRRNQLCTYLMHNKTPSAGRKEAFKFPKCTKMLLAYIMPFYLFIPVLPNAHCSAISSRQQHSVKHLEHKGMAVRKTTLCFWLAHPLTLMDLCFDRAKRLLRTLMCNDCVNSVRISVYKAL